VSNPIPFSSFYLIFYWLLMGDSPQFFVRNLIASFYTGYTQKNGAVSKANKNFISHHTRAQRTPSAAAAVQVSHALPAFRFSCLLRVRGASFQYGVAAGKGFLCGHRIRRI